MKNVVTEVLNLAFTTKRIGIIVKYQTGHYFLLQYRKFETVNVSKTCINSKKKLRFIKVYCVLLSK